MAEFRQHLVTKNVASDIADELCEKITRNLDGVTVASFTTVKSRVKEAMESALVRSLPAREIFHICLLNFPAVSCRRAF